VLTLYKRHTKKCAERRLTTEPGKTLGELRADRGCRRCTCSIYAEGTLRIDSFVRKATGEVKWEKAEDLKRKWEEAGTLEVARPAPPSPGPQEPPTIEHVVQQFMNDRKACGLSRNTLKKYRQFIDLLRGFCEGSGIVYNAIRNRPGLAVSRILDWVFSHEPQAAGTYEGVFLVGGGARLD
jgi:hypothetical protein